MNREEQIMKWYSQIQSVSLDDKADYDVMLLDLANTGDAMAALNGMMTNILSHGFKSDLFQMISDGTKVSNAPEVQHLSVVVMLQICIAHDPIIRKDKDAQEWILDMLEVHHELALFILTKMNQLQKKVMPKLFHSIDIRDTLIYQLVVVNQYDHKRYGKS